MRHVAKVQKKIAESLFSEDISANKLFQILSQIILSLIEQVKEVVPGSDHPLLCEDTRMI